MKLWEHTPAELAVIPLPDLALLVLADFRESDGWHKGNWINEANQNHREHVRFANLGNRLLEA